MSQGEGGWEWDSWVPKGKWVGDLVPGSSQEPVMGRIPSDTCGDVRGLTWVGSAGRCGTHSGGVSGRGVCVPICPVQP